MTRSDGAPKRCAIYTRKSSEEGLDQNFNSLHAQRQACEAFVKSQAGECWRLIKTAYDDGGFSGATLDRPALKALLEHVKEKRIDVVVVYKVDRLTRSLADFAKIVEIFDAHGVSFVAVTQQFNTTTSMGRLTLNVLLSFAQFEREVTGERIRDKIAASKQKGMWMGGTPPLGYDLRDRHLVVNKAEAETVRLIFRLYIELKTLRRVREELDRKSVLSKQWASRGGVRHGGYAFGRGALYHLLANPIYVGEIRHKSVTYPGQHEAIIERATWHRVQEMLSKKATHPRGQTVRKGGGMLMGKLFDESGEPLYSCWAKKGQRRYRYLVSKRLVKGTAKPDDGGWRLPAERTEQAVIVGIRRILSDRGATGLNPQSLRFCCRRTHAGGRGNRWRGQILSTARDDRGYEHAHRASRAEAGRHADHAQSARVSSGRSIPRRRSQPAIDPPCPAADEASWHRNAPGAPRRSGRSSADRSRSASSAGPRLPVVR